MATTHVLENNYFRIYSAQKFLEGLLQTQLSANNLYVWIGKSTEWPSGDTTVAAVNDNDSARAALFPDMIAIKKVAPSDAILVIPNVPWTASTVYSQYSYTGAVGAGGVYFDQFDPSVSAPPFYVITGSNNVYKCLNNNSGGLSSIEPTGTGTTPIVLGDGYHWKFMFQVSTQNAQKFLTDLWIPIYTLTYNDGSAQWAVQATAVPGVNLPQGGHGANPVNELGGMYVMINIQLNYDEAQQIPVDISYREFGLLLNPLTYGAAYGSQNFYTALIGVATTNLTLSSVTGTYSTGDSVVGETSGATATVVDWNEVPNVIRLNNVVGTFQTSETLHDTTSSATANISTVANPSFQPNSGMILETEFFQPAVTRAPTQVDNFNLVIPF
jgi:hypothetical protein